MNKKAFDILKEEFKAKGLEVAEETIVKSFEALEAAAPRLSVESDEAYAKTIGAGLAIVLPALKPALLKIADLNKDGQIG